MAHQHGHARLVRRQRGRQEEDDDAVETVIEIVTVPNTRATRIVAVTTDAPKTLVPPAVATRPFSTATEDDDDDKTTSTRPTTSATSRRPASTTHSTESEAEETSTVRSINDQSTLMVATKSPIASNSGSLVGALVSATASATASISATPTSGASDGESEGMSGGAKAGLALGILVGVAALLAGILFVYRRKKNSIAAEKDNEKIGMHTAPAPLPPQVPTGAAAAAPSIRTNRTLSTAPRLSLRPVTQFDPTFNEQRKSGGNLLTVAAAAAPVDATQDRSASSEERPVSAWERRGAANAVQDVGAAPAANPFNDPQTPANSQPPANPFGNSAALDAAHAVIPDSPPQASPQHSANPSTDLDARLAPTSSAAPVAGPEVDAVAVAMAMSNVPMSEHDFPAPPGVNANTNSVPPSPAWTEDVPSSPAMGTPMIAGAAGAMAAGRPNGPPGPNNVHRVQLDFKPSMGDELELKAGTLVRMLHEYDDGWALCISMDRTQQGVVPRTCLSKHPVKPRTGPPRQGPPPPHMRGPPIRSPMGPGGIPQPRPMSPADGRSSPHPPALSPASGRMSPGPRQMHSPQMHGPRNRAHSNAPYPGSPQARGRSNSNAPYAGPPRSMSPGPYGGGPMAPPPQMGRPRSNSASQVHGARRGPAPGPSPMNPNAGPAPAPLGSAVPNRKPVPGMAL
ncbi:variant SH3 domain-containing protein [Stagonosporopsis vannaccii]|nr:variant SH3 domain-containing protein [Stagonosporopsis vannaccii]